MKKESDLQFAVVMLAIIMAISSFADACEVNSLRHRIEKVEAAICK